MDSFGFRILQENSYLRACLHGGRGPQICEVTCGGSPHQEPVPDPTYHVTNDQIKMRDYVDRRVTPPKRVTSPTWGPPPLCKQALTLYYLVFLALSVMMTDRLPLRAEFIWYYFRSV